MNGLAIRLVLTVLVGFLGVFFIRLYRVRSHVRSLQKQGLVRPVLLHLWAETLTDCGQPIPPHRFLLGHLKFVAGVMGKLPPYIHGVYIADQIRQIYPEMDTAFYLDIWPVGEPHLMLIKPDLVYQLTQANQLPKFPGLTTFLTPLAGKHNLVTMEGALWKRWRSIFNSGFSSSHISSLVPGMVEKIEIFISNLSKHAKAGKMFFLEEMLLNLTIDIIGGAVM